ncbi:MAG: HAMP domain-containing histidine kinase [Calditerrivibrio sp.]|nr:HAMP domain-containing histidine kinase [Calditerrivibrio sp.]
MIYDEINSITLLNHTSLEKSLSEAIVYDDIYTIFRIAETIVNNTPLYSNVFVTDKNNEFILDAKSTKKYPDSLLEKNLKSMDLKLSDMKVGRIIFQINETFIKNKLRNGLIFLISVHIIAYIIVIFLLHKFIDYLLKPFLNLVDKLESSVSFEEIDRNIHLSDNDPKEIVKMKNVLVELSTKLRKQVEINIEKEKEILKRDKVVSLGMMAAGLAHHIKNPIMTIKLLLGTIRMEIVNKDLYKDLDVIDNELKKMLNVVNEFMNLHRSDNTVISDFRVSELFKKLVENFKHYEGIKITTSEDDMFIRSDFNKMLIIYENLILNSIEAGAKNISIKIVKSQNDIYFEIVDDGKGIDEDKFDMVFMPFFTTKLSGTGLGLSYVQHLVSLLNMDIYIDKNYKSGTKFVLKYRYE